MSAHTVLQLTVQNHPGVMSHVCGLFARRAYNLEGIVCLPVGDGRTSRMMLLVNEDQRLDQVVRQTRKLIDVLEVAVLEEDVTLFKELRADLM